MTDEQRGKLVPVDQSTDLANLAPIQGDLVSEYWSPEEGETQRCVFIGIEEQSVPDFNDASKNVMLKCVVLAFQVNNAWRRMCNGSKRLVAVFEGNEVPANTPFEITYFGEEKNKTNNNKSGRWSVVPLVAAAKE